MRKHIFTTLLLFLALFLSCTKSKEVHPELGDGNEEIITVGTQTANIENQRTDISLLLKIVFNYGPSDGYGLAQYYDTANMVLKTDRFTLDLNDLNCNTLYYYYYHLYYSNGDIIKTSTKSFRTLNCPDVPNDAIAGLFTINEDGDKVFFSKGNVQFNETSNEWRFAENQYEYNAEGWTNLFNWDIQNDVINEGCFGDQWRTLSGDDNGEWYYVFNCRTTLTDIRFAKAVVNNVNGVILVPDDWDTDTYMLNNPNTSGASYTDNVIRKSAWTDTIERVGCVFLPAAGSSDSLLLNNEGMSGLYWSASSVDDEYAFGLTFGNDYLGSGTSWNYRRDGFSVRLVKDYYSK